MIQLIPAIDLIDGKCVRLVKGDFRLKTVYHHDPVDVAKRFEDTGFRRLHIVDLEGAGKGRLMHLKIMEKIAAETRLVTDFGGGIKTCDDVRSIFNAGASMVCIGSMAVKNEEEFDAILNEFGGDKVMLAADARDKNLVISGWKEDAGISLFHFIDNMTKKDVSSVLCTDVDRDGMLSGSSVKLYKEILDSFPGLFLVASGGIGSVSDIEALDEAGVPAVVFGKAWYDGKIGAADIKRFLR